MQCVSLQFTSVRADPMSCLDHLQDITWSALTSLPCASHHIVPILVVMQIIWRILKAALVHFPAEASV